MKRYVRAGKLKNFVTQQISKKFDENEILCKALLGTHGGSPMMYVFFNIMLDPNVEIENKDDPHGAHTIFLNGKNVGWIDFERGIGDIDDKAYNKIQKQDPEVLSQLFEQAFGQLMQARIPGFTGGQRPDEYPEEPLYIEPSLDDGYDGDEGDYGDDEGDFGDDEGDGYW